MAERRMFAKTIIDSDVFIDMPQSTQNLYFHLSMRADDEGFINNPKKIMRMIGSSEDDLKILLSKRYLLSFESGVVVIKHWKIHNYIQNDRFKPTLYQEEKTQLITKENKSYTEQFKNLDTKCVQYGDTGKVRLGKISIDKDSIEEINTVSKKPTKHKYGEYKNVLLSDTQYSKLLEDWGQEKLDFMIQKLDEGIQLKAYKYKDHNLAIRKWEKETKFIPKKEQEEEFICEVF